MSFRGRGGHALGAYAIGGSGPEEGWLIDGEFVGLEKRDGTFSIVQNQELETKGFVRALSNLQGFGATIDCFLFFINQAPHQLIVLFARMPPSHKVIIHKSK